MAMYRRNWVRITELPSLCGMGAFFISKMGVGREENGELFSKAIGAVHFCVVRDYSGSFCSSSFVRRPGTTYGTTFCFSGGSGGTSRKDGIQ